MSAIVISTARLNLRLMRLDDDAFVLRLVNQSSFINNIGDKGVRDLFSAREHIHSSYLNQYEKLGFGLWVVALKSNQQPIGVCGLVKRDALTSPDIGYAFLDEAAGNGYATEAGLAVMKYAKNQLGIKKIVAITATDNTASQRVLVKLGLEFKKQVYLPGYHGASCYFEECSHTLLNK